MRILGVDPAKLTFSLVFCPPSPAWASCSPSRSRTRWSRKGIGPRSSLSSCGRPELNALNPPNRHQYQSKETKRASKTCRKPAKTSENPAFSWRLWIFLVRKTLRPAVRRGGTPRQPAQPRPRWQRARPCRCRLRRRPWAPQGCTSLRSDSQCAWPSGQGALVKLQLLQHVLHAGQAELAGDLS